MLNNFSRVAIIAHVFYIDLWEELSSCIQNIVNVASEADVFVTISEVINEYDGLRIREAFPNADIKRLPNKGFDVGPFFEVLGRIDLDSYDYVVKLHTKRNRFGIVNFLPLFGSQWRKMLLGFCSSVGNVRRTFSIFEKSPAVGMVGSGTLIMSPNDELTGKYSLSGSKNGPGMEPCNWCFIAGTMFAVRAKLLCELSSRFSIDDFQILPIGSHDVDLAHSIEREFGHEIYRLGFQIAPSPKAPFLYVATFRLRRALYAMACAIFRIVLNRRLS